VFGRQQAALASRDDYRPSLAAIACPSLVIGGSDDPLATPKLAYELAAGIPGAGIEIIPRCGHYSVLERPGEVNAVVSRFVAEAVEREGA
jgi:pimeloyl-ACP methyl ester carboxylesterase